LLKKSQAGQELFDMVQIAYAKNPFGKMSNMGAFILVFLGGALIYHFVVNMRRGK